MIAPHEAHRCVPQELTALIADYARTAQRFTVVELRDQLLKVSGLEDADPVQLRYRVRDRLLTLEKHGQVHQVAVAREAACGLCGRPHRRRDAGRSGSGAPCPGVITSLEASGSL